MSNIDLNLLKSLSPLESLSPENLRELAAKSNTTKVPKGKLLFKAGDKDGLNIYILNGVAETYDGNNQRVKKFEGGTEDAKKPISNIQPHTHSCRTLSDCLVLSVDNNLLDIMITWSQTGSYEVEGLDESEDGQEGWMSQILSCKAFHQVPPANIQALFLYMEQIDAAPGQKIITQGEDGDYFYVIKTGKALVTRATKSNPKGIKLADLGPGDSFGEEALISESKRNATITMLSRGSLVRLSKENFVKLLKEPVLQKLNRDSGNQLVSEGKAKWLDVRLPAEFKAGHIEGAENSPLISLRIKCDSMDTSTQWLLYCDTGRRSSAAAYLLAERGFDIAILEGGLNAQ